jgi:hypothetical protein
MKVFTDFYVSLRNAGYLTLQVPDTAICFGGPGPQMIEAPDEWFEYLKAAPGKPGPDGLSPMRRVVGRERGFLFLSRAGFEANKQPIRQVWEQALAEGRTNRGRGDVSWEGFQAFAAEHFDLVDRATKAHAQKLADKAARAAIEAAKVT